MDRELDIAALASLGGWLKRKPNHHVAPPGTPCANCETPLQGPYCHACGQLAEDFHRSFGPLVEETFENLLHIDGRLWRTLPRLALKPSGLTRDYLEDHRASQIPPLRLFLVVVLLFFFVGGLGEAFHPAGKPGQTNIRVATPDDPSITPTQRAKIKAVENTFGFTDDNKPSALSDWLKPRVLYASSHQKEFSLVLESWTHRFAVMLLPVSALLLGLLFVNRRKLFFYDHLIFSMHSLSFMGLLLSARTLIVVIPVVGGIGDLLYLVMPVHLFVHMRGVYRSGVFSTLVRMALLGTATFFVVILGFVGLVAVGIVSMPGT